MPDRDKDGRNSYRALDIKILPPGTLILEENVYECVRGIVARAPTLAQRSNFGGGRDGGGGGGTRPGAGKFTVVPVVTDEEKGDRGVVSGKEEVLVASLHPKVRMVYVLPSVVTWLLRDCGPLKCDSCSSRGV